MYFEKEAEGRSGLFSKWGGVSGRGWGRLRSGAAEGLGGAVPRSPGPPGRALTWAGRRAGRGSPPLPQAPLQLPQLLLLQAHRVLALPAHLAAQVPLAAQAPRRLRDLQLDSQLALQAAQRVLGEHAVSDPGQRPPPVRPPRGPSQQPPAEPRGGGAEADAFPSHGMGP